MLTISAHDSRTHSTQTVNHFCGSSLKTFLKISLLLYKFTNLSRSLSR